MDDCLFCSIIKYLKPAALIFEDKDVFIFLDHRPLFLGHCLLTPKLHVQTLTDLPTELITPFFTCLQQLTKVVQVGMNAQGTFVAANNVVSQSVAHLHFHVVPRNKGDGLKGFFWPRHKYDEEALLTTQSQLVNTWTKLYPQ